MKIFVWFALLLSLPAFGQDATTGMPAPSLFGTGAPTKTCSATNLSGVLYLQTDATNGRIWLCDNSTGSWAWDHLVLPVSGTTVSIGGTLLLVGTPVTGTATILGAVIGMVCAGANATDGSLPPAGVIIACAVTSANTITVQISAAVAGITPPAKTYNVRVLQ